MVIGYLGTLSFIIIYVGSLILGSLLSLYFHKDEYHYSAVGASGAVMGIIYSAILLQPGMSLMYIFYTNTNSCLYFWNWLFIVFYLWYEKQDGQYWS